MNLHSTFFHSQMDVCNSQRMQTNYRNVMLDRLDVQQVMDGSSSPRGCYFCIRLNDDGSLLAATSEKIEIWDPNSGKSIVRLRRHTEIVTSFVWLHQLDSYTSENKCFFTSSLDKSIVFWKKYEPQATLTDQDDWIRCLGISKDNEMLVSGCVSSKIFVWDVATTKIICPIRTAHESTVYPELNTINTISFSPVFKNLFVSGARDGVVKLWDTRTLSQSTKAFQAHTCKLNSVSMTEANEHLLLTGGRDNAVRLWDIRQLSDTSSIPEVGKGGLLVEYNKHKCNGYNVSSNFFNGVENVISGSEENKIYIYDTNSGEVVKTLEDQGTIIHLVDTTPSNPLQLVSSNVESNNILLWAPKAVDSNIKESPREKIPQNPESSRLMGTQRSVIESLMKKHGDQILKIFHKFNFTFSNPPTDLQALLSSIASTNNPQLLRTLHEIASDFAKAITAAETEYRESMETQQTQTTQQQTETENETENDTESTSKNNMEESDNEKN